MLDARRRVDVRLVLGAPRRARPFPGLRRPSSAVYRNYRRWGFESAALDLALRQAGHVAAGGPRPRAAAGHVRRLLADGRARRRSTPVARRLARYPDLRFKLDATPGLGRRADRRAASRPAPSTRSTSRAPTRARAVDVDDRPGVLPPHRRGVPGRLARGPRPRRRGRARRRSRPFQDRITWDAPIHSVDDILAAPVIPRTVNLKPSRFGSVKALFDGLRVLRAARDGRLRRRPVRARRRARPDPAARRAVPPRRAQRHRPRRLRRARPRARPAAEPARPGARAAPVSAAAS